MSSDDSTLAFADMVKEAIEKGCTRIKQLPCFLLWLFQIEKISVRTIQRRLKKEHTTFFKLRKLVVIIDDKDDNGDIPGDILIDDSTKSKGKQKKGNKKGKHPGIKKKSSGKELTIDKVEATLHDALYPEDDDDSEYDTSLLNIVVRFIDMKNKQKPTQDEKLEEMLDKLSKSRTNLRPPPEV